MLFRALQLCAAASVACATNLFVSDYAGNITTLELTARHGNYYLNSIHSHQGCAPNPSWLTLDPNHGTLYCLDEGLYVDNGSVSSYTIGDDGALTRVSRETTISGPVSGVIYGNPAGERSIALAHYTGSALSSWNLDLNATASLTFNQDILFTIPSPGPNAERQDAPHEHQAIADPTGQFILVPDLGADLVRVFSFDSTTKKLVAETPLHVVPGSGPRHAVFYQPYGGVYGANSTSYLFLVAELSNTVTSYAVTYPAAGGLAFKQVYNSTVYGDNPLPVGNAAAEIAISPDNRFLTISNRNDTSFNIPNPDGSNSTIPSDSMTTFTLNPNGTLSFLQVYPAGGSYPRHYSFNKVGDLVAVGLQYDEAVVILSRDVKSGKLGKPVARWEASGNVTCVQWEQ